MSDWLKNVLIDADASESAAPSKLNAVFIGLLVFFGIFAVMTPQEEFSCDDPRPLFVSPGESTSGHLSYCLFRETLQSPRGIVRRPDVNTGECYPSKDLAEQARVARAAADTKMLQHCIATIPTPPEATWRHIKAFFAKFQ
ncbi:uroporphyrinogen III synthase [Novimethylophilus kurashikiensis]|uniref:Uroporphyrinogen III synthase n=1 Tax=Novimethylophilus kurashikiensis TaxID=1825523 RepID=A0A2R5FEM8_9PROT|nr:hypothetical protein [Novimethylophilus kurashikiensis]GBG14884.1 uroporphyrinogen III synthase [Novimethylophilus kurashikiensis]